VTGTQTIFDGSQATSMMTVTDGTSNTIMIIENAAGPASWAAPQEWNSDSGQLPPGNHPKVILVGFADGSVRPMEPAKIQPFIKQLSNRQDGQVVPQF
jgi:hypothetical protein